MDQESTFQSFFSNRLRERGYSIEKLAKVTGITIKHLENLSTGNFDALPATPYLHGYIVKIASVLDFDPEPWWAELKRERMVKSSGSDDALPKNRFAHEAYRPKIWVGGGVLVLVVLYVALRYNTIFGEPTITVISPAEDVITVHNEHFVVHGNAKNTDQVSVNGAQTPVGSDGAFEESVLLQPGLNSIEVKASKLLGHETSVLRQVVYEPDKTEPVQPAPSPASSSQSTSTKASSTP